LGEVFGFEQLLLLRFLLRSDTETLKLAVVLAQCLEALPAAFLRLGRFAEE
jgi:hypothetical protein